MSTEINIEPLCAMASSILKKISFSEQKHQIINSTRSLLNDRINNPLFEIGNISIKFVLQNKTLHLEFSDDGERYFSKQNNFAETAKMILNTVDSFCISSYEKRKNSYCLNFNYNETFDADKYLCKDVPDIILI